MLGRHANGTTVPNTSKTSPLTSAPPPPPSSGGNLKYMAIGLAFLVGAAVLWVVANDKKEPPPQATAPVPEVQRVNPMEKPELELEEQPEPEQPAVEPTPTASKGGRKAGGEWDCSGDLPNAAMVINQNRPQIRSCYERRLKVNNVLQGDLKLRLKVGSGGKVVNTAVAGSIKDPEVFACVRSLAQSWTFPVPTGGNCAVVQVPFQFSPKNP